MEKITLKHLNYLTDGFSIWQHTSGHKIDRKHGYALDDAARALLVVQKFQDKEKINIYLDFLSTAISPKEVINFFDGQQNPLPIKWSEDALGEAFWAISECYAAGMKTSQVAELLSTITKYIEKMTSVRGRAYSLLGAANVDKTLTRHLADSLMEQVNKNAKKEWFWIENKLTYANAIIPLALLKASCTLKDKNMESVGLKLLDFLNSRTKYGKMPIAIGNKGWYQRGSQKAIYDQQPIDPAYQVLANVEAYKIIGEPKYLTEAKVYFSWFWGNNVANHLVINLKSQSCYDGIMKEKLKKNQGSENIVCYLLAQEAIWEYLDKV